MASIFKRRKGKHERYTFQYTDHAGKSCTAVGFTDKGLTEQLAGKLEGEARMRRTGLIDVEQERLAENKRTGIEDHLQAFAVSLTDNSPKHQIVTMARVRRLVAECGFKTLADIAQEPIQA